MRPVIIAAMFLLASCGQSASDQQADQLENAAAQSDPAAAEVLENAADAIRDGDMAANGQDQAQDALQAAGNAQAGTPSPPENP